MRRTEVSSPEQNMQPAQSAREIRFSQRDIWTGALGMLDSHGPDALEMATCQAEAMIDRGDVSGAELWSRILGAIQELQRPAPRHGEAIH
jgi:hypothetical protein